MRLLNSSSSSGNTAKNSSLFMLSENPFGNTPSTSMSSNSSSKPISRAKINNLRATSAPDKSSRGSGSVKPFSFASKVASERLKPSSNWPKMKEREPDKIPSNFSTSSPAASKFCKFSITGKPAPTFVSYKNLC